MRRFRKLGLVLGGYAVALLIAYATTAVLEWLFPPQDASGGMQAFGDSLRFLGLFGILALIPTALALYFLRSSEKFWAAFSIASLAVAATGPVAAFMMGRPHATDLIFGFIGLMKVLGAPLLGIGFLIFAAIAPTGRSRWTLLAASGIEFAVGGYAYFCLLVLGHWLL